MVLYVRTWGFRIASKRDQDHQNRSSYEKVMHVLLSVCRLFSAGTEVPGKFWGKFRDNQRVCTYVSNRGPEVPGCVFLCVTGRFGGALYKAPFFPIELELLHLRFPHSFELYPHPPSLKTPIHLGENYPMDLGFIG